MSAVEELSDGCERFQSAYLGVERSVTSRRWVKRDFDAREAETMSQRLGIDPALAAVLSSRGIQPDEADAYLNPSLRSAMPDPFVLKDMQQAVGRLAAAVKANETIGIFGDYDVDGTTSASLLTRYFRSLNVAHEVYLPDRITEGYGPNLKAFRYLQEKGASLCVTVDCGAMAHEILAQVEQDGMDVVVLDHHQMTLPAPPAAAVVNPNRPDDLSGLGNLSAAGVTFMMLVALNRKLREDGYFAETKEPNLLKWLDLVALGLMCDVMPLQGLTRVLVAQGLKAMGRFDDDAVPVSDYPGLFQLARQAGASGEASAYHLGFVLGPRINAAGRIGHANLAWRMMTEQDPARATDWAQKLHALNTERQAIESEVQQQAVAQIESARKNGPHKLVIASGEKWHPGVIGIVAGRLKEKYGCPSIVIAFEDGLGKGSGRSIEGVDLGGAIAAATREGLLVAGGGHAMAAGLTIEQDKLPAFEAFLEERLQETIEESQAQASLKVDAVITLAGVTRAFSDKLAAAGPFGQGNPEPRVVIENVRIKYADIKGDKHIACTLTDALGNTARSITFRCVGEPLGDALLEAGNQPVHIVGRVKPDDWRGGNAAQIHLEDLAFA
jgi:single-stranded-DNA-specific exonuclease